MMAVLSDQQTKQRRNHAIRFQLFLLQRGQLFMTSEWMNYPMGPQLRAYLGVSDESYQGHLVKDINRRLKEALEDKVLTQLDKVQLRDEDQLIALIDEFVSMDLPHLAIKTFEINSGLWKAKDFRGCLSLGIAYMLVRDLNEAASKFLEAQAILPSEPAPYVNLAQIYMAQGDWQTALTWCEAGLNYDKNHFPLWQLFGEVTFELYGPDFIFRLKNKAQNLGSWAGISLYAAQDHLIQPNTKVELLSSFYSEGERSQQFLLEYTAALGAAGAFDQIPTVIWQCFPDAKKRPWQLGLHKAQAHLALGQKEAFYEQITALQQNPQVPEAGRNEISLLETEGQEVFQTLTP